MIQLAKSVALSLFAFVWCAPSVHAEDREQLVEGARGPTLEAAVTNGLVRALEQVKGFRLDASIGVRKKHHAEKLEITNGMEDWFARLDVDDLSTGSVDRATNGLIRSYAITRQEQDPKTKDWIVDLKVVVPVYDAENPREGGLRTIAFAGFETAAPSFDLAGARVPASEVNRKLVDACIVRFSKAPKLEVLNRDFLAELNEEYDLIGGAHMAFDEQIKLGNRMGADYLVVGTLEELSWTERERVVEVTDYRTIEAEAAYTISFKVLDVATSKTIHAGTARALYGNADLKRLTASSPNLRVSEFLVELAASDMARQILDPLFPIKVVRTSGGRVLITADPSRAAVGDVFDVWLVGEPIVFEGEVLGQDERRVATVRVAELRDKFAYAELVQGQIEELEPGAICRRR